MKLDDNRDYLEIIITAIIGYLIGAGITWLILMSIYG